MLLRGLFTNKARVEVPEPGKVFPQSLGGGVLMKRRVRLEMLAPKKEKKKKISHATKETKKGVLYDDVLGVCFRDHSSSQLRYVQYDGWMTHDLCKKKKG